MLVTFQWSGKPQALHVLREQGSETGSGAIVARHLATLQVAASPCHSKKHKWDRWVSFARRRQSKTGSASTWLATSAEARLLLVHGAMNSACGSRMRLLQVQVRTLLSSCQVKYVSKPCWLFLGSIQDRCSTQSLTPWLQGTH